MSGFFIIDILGTRLLPEEKRLLEHPNVGAVILFTRNFENPAQLCALIADIRALNLKLLIAVDHEGGYIQRFQRHGFKAIPAARVFGETYDLHRETGMQLAKIYGTFMAEDLLRHDIDLSFAPVLDLQGDSQIIGQYDRAFHATPQGVIDLAGAFIDGMTSRGMPCVGKHFPGHGNVIADSHTSKVIYDRSYEQLMQTDVLPFATLIANKQLDAIMPAHVIYPAVDSQHAAGFSTIWLQDILRNQLRFDGVVISDCLGMAGADIGNLMTRAVQALSAGCDMLIVCNQDRETIFHLIDDIKYQQSDDSLRRILAFKRKMQYMTQTKKTLPPIETNTICTTIPASEYAMFNKTDSV